MGYLIACRESLPRVIIPHQPNAIRSTTTKLSVNNFTTIFTRRSLRLLASRLALSSRVAPTPRRQTHGDEWAMNLREGLTLKPIHPSAWKWNSANFAVTEFSEVGSKYGGALAP
jgi:hypothetical protein